MEKGEDEYRPYGGIPIYSSWGLHPGLLVWRWWRMEVETCISQCSEKVGRHYDVGIDLIEGLMNEICEVCCWGFCDECAVEEGKLEGGRDVGWSCGRPLKGDDGKGSYYWAIIWRCDDNKMFHNNFNDPSLLKPRKADTSIKCQRGLCVIKSRDVL